MNVRALCLLVAGLAGLPAVSGAAPVQVDKGRFAVYLHDQLIGAETFSLEGTGDSLNLFSRAWRKLHTEQGEESLKKQLVLVAQRDDYGLKSYQSNQTYRSDVLVRGIVMGDTAFTLYREFNGTGEGDRKVLPPGRLFVLDSQLFSLVNLISLSLRDKTFETWPVTMVTLGPQDSIVAGSAADLGHEVIRWSSRPVRARKLRLSDGSTTFLVYADAAGRMLRMTHEASGLRVEREAAPVKKRAPRPAPSPAPKGGG